MSTPSSTRPFLTNPRCQPGKPHDLLRLRSLFLHTIRHFFTQHDFLEVETPILISYADPSPHLASFRTWYHHPYTEQKHRLFLQTSPEFAMKRLVAAGYPKIFQICKFFRDNEDSPLHNPEFTGLEWYETHADYDRLMEMTEAMCLALWPERKLRYQGKEYDLQTPWERLTVHQALERYAGIKLPEKIHYDDLAQACKQKGLTVTHDDAWDDLFFKLLITFVEPHLGMERPTFLLDYPTELAALARTKPGHPAIAERVELYIAGLELANGYSELIDPSEQKQRWEADAALRKERGDEDDFSVDPSFLAALEAGMPQTTGIAIGLDRLLMLYLDAASITEVLPFPYAPSKRETR
ncbi:MAG: EF-P lysine aminoacylase GenX [Myxococcales bacterium]|nr:EF-P lysine aminoacylase GenX [Myxococcales bacterium]